MLSSTSRTRSSISVPVVAFSSRCEAQDQEGAGAIHRKDVLLLEIDPVKSAANVVRLWLSGLPFLDALVEPQAHDIIEEADQITECDCHSLATEYGIHDDYLEDPFSDFHPHDIHCRGKIVSRRRKVDGQMTISFFKLHGKPGGDKELRRRRARNRDKRSDTFRRLRREELRWQARQFE